MLKTLLLCVTILLAMAHPAMAIGVLTGAANDGGGIPSGGSDGDCLLKSGGVGAWGACPGAGTGAPTTSGYLTKTADATLSNEFALGSLATGLLKNTTTTGVPTIAVAGTDYVAPGGALGTPTSGTLTNATGLPIVAGTTGTLSIARGGTNATSFTASRCIQSAADGLSLEVAAAACGTGSGYATVQDEGSGLTQRATVNFTGAGVSCADNAGSSRTDCTITGSGGGLTHPEVMARASIGL